MVNLVKSGSHTQAIYYMYLIQNTAKSNVGKYCVPVLIRELHGTVDGRYEWRMKVMC